MSEGETIEEHETHWSAGDLSAMLIRFLLATSFADILILAASCLASNGPVVPQDIDTSIDQAIVRTINLGAPLYNRGDHAGCYRLYQGALMVIQPMLGHRPELRQVVANGLGDAEIPPSYAQRATELRKVLDQVLFTIRTSPTSTRAPAPRPPISPPLWSRLGGEAAVRALVHELMSLAVKDPQVDVTRGGKHPLDAAAIDRIEILLVEFISSLSGGPLQYQGRDMKSVHRGMGITDAQFYALAGDLAVVLRKFAVSKREADELLTVFAATRKDLVGARSTDTASPPSPPNPPAALTLWSRLGGQAAVAAIVHDLVSLATSDPQVDFTRGGKHPLDDKATQQLEILLAELISAVTGGPLEYRGRDMRSVHQGMGITDAQFKTFVNDLALVLKKRAIPKKAADELLAVIAAARKDVVEVPRNP